MKIWVAIIVMLIGYNLWPFAWHGFFYQCMAIAILLIFWHIRKQGKFGEFGYWLAWNNLIDEIPRIGTPTTFGWNEYIFAIIILITFVCPTKFSTLFLKS